MITAVQIKNFKSIKSISENLPGFVVIVGPNGSGKSNFVGALELFGEILRRGSTDPARELGWAQIIRRAKKPARAGLTLGVTVRLPLENFYLPQIKKGARSTEELDIQASITLEGNLYGEDVTIKSENLIITSSQSTLRICSEEDLVEPGTDPILWSLFYMERLRAAVWKTPDEARVGLKQIYFQGRAKDNDEVDKSVLQILNRIRFRGQLMKLIANQCEVRRIRLDSSALRSDSGFKEPSSSLLGPSGEGLPAAVERLRGHGKSHNPAFVRVLNSLQKVFPKIEDVHAARLQPGRLTLFFKEQGISEEFGQANVSDGVLHALAMLVMLEGRPRTGGASILVIEEPENAIHPWSVRTMVEQAQKSRSSQVIITTHSETVVNAVEDTKALFITENRGIGGTTLTRALAKEKALDSILVETGQKLGDVWMDGTLGGVPTS